MQKKRNGKTRKEKRIKARPGGAVGGAARAVTARFFAERVMPEAGALRRKIEGGADSIMALPVEMFLAA